ncbi:MAG TPA: hypothetical protein VK550_36595 [Polyangiaceae bacterium]|nr:hypothetical protein [Polyangiaceae bacterium]
MKQNTGTFAALTAALLVGSTLGVGCGGRLTASESAETGGSGGSAQTGGSAGNGGTAGSTGGTGTTGGTGATGGSTGGGGSGATGGSTGGGGTDPTGGSTGGGDTGGAAGTTGGTGGTGMGGAGGSGGGTTPPGTVACGTSICGPIMGGPVGTLQPCCPMDTPNACGAQSPLIPGCLTTTPGVADTRCPTVQVMGIPLTGCCRPNRMCGVNLQVVGLGCNDPVAVGGMPAGRCGGEF